MRQTAGDQGSAEVLRRLDVGAAVTPHGVRQPASILTLGGRIVACGMPSSVGETPGAEVSQHPGLTAVPGFIDLQVNGFGGVDFLHAGVDDWVRAGETLLRRGVTAWCPTLVSSPKDAYSNPLTRMALVGENHCTPRLLGAHLEGPFLAPSRRGAHDATALCEPDIAWVETLLAESAVPIAIWTLAPELPGAFDVIRHLAARGVVASVGHSDATYAEVVASRSAGATMVTHLFNAQRPLHQREPGVVGAAMLLDGLFVGLILDGVHVVEPVASLALAQLGRRAFIVSDAVATAGAPASHCSLGTRRIEGANGAAIVAGSETLAGSLVDIAAGFARAVRLLDLERAVELVAETPARALGRDDIGHLAPGCQADIVLIDSAFGVREVFRGGVPVAASPEMAL